jgi:hypothetical protein
MKKGLRIDKMMLISQGGGTLRKTGPSVTLFTINSTWSGLGL